MRKIFHWNEQNVKTLITMKNERYSLKEIGLKLNITTNCVSKALTRYHEKYIKIKRIQHKKEKKKEEVIFSIFQAIKWFNEVKKNRRLKIKRIGDDNYEYGALKNLSLISILLIINYNRIKEEKKIIPLWSMLLV